MPKTDWKPTHGLRYVTRVIFLDQSGANVCQKERFLQQLWMSDDDHEWRDVPEFPDFD